MSSIMPTSFVSSVFATRQVARTQFLPHGARFITQRNATRHTSVPGTSRAMRVTTTASADAPSSAAASDGTAKTVIDVLRERGLLEAATAEDDVLRPLLQTSVGVYTGFDPTADSLHLGNLLAIIALAWFQRLGHRVFALIGGATGKIGDPSGKSAERPVLDDAVIARNLLGIERNLRQVLDRSAAEVTAAGGTPGQLTVVNNYDWVSPISFLDFLRDVGKQARINSMLAKDAVRSRLETDDGMSFTEFTYQLLQAYDFMHLNETEGVTFQLGGSDQWGNITAGTELTRKMRGRAVHGITFPLLTTADGRKFGKSEKGAVWLTPEQKTPYEFYQFLFKTPDNDVIRFLKRLTFLPLDQIAVMEQAMTKPDYVANTAQKMLAEEVTRIVHGHEGVASALAATAAAAPGSQAVLSADALEAISGDMPSLSLTRDELIGAPLIDMLVQGGIQKSKGEARRLIKNGGAYINNEKIGDVDITIADGDLIDNRMVLLAAGKKRKLLIRVE